MSDDPDNLDAVVAEADADADPEAPVYETTMHGRVWTFHKPDVRPAALRRYKALAAKVTATGTDNISDDEAIELSATAEDMLRSGLATPAEREAFDLAPFGGTEIGELSRAYFTALGATAGESSASPAPSPNTVARSRRTSKSTTQ
ncbi:MAG: hypothetical protein ACRD0P_31690 [Stackebrandtia sp.]